MNERGYLEGSEMATTFNMLRANDLIWSFVINNYLLGRDPFPFDLLHWNCDSTRMPAAMHSYYLRNMYMNNLLREPGALTLAGTKIDLSKVTTPAYFVSAIEDHIAPWKTTYAGTAAFQRQDPLRAIGIGSHRGHGESACRQQVRLLDQRQAPGRTGRMVRGTRSSTKARGGRTGASGSRPTSGAKCPRACPAKASSR